MHPILTRQLRRLGAADGTLPPSRFAEFLAIVDRTYGELENDRKFAEHTLRTVSDELFRANEQIRAEAERRLANKDAQLAMALQSAGDGLWTWDAGTGVLEFSPGWLAGLGYDPETFPGDAGEACRTLIVGDEIDSAARAFASVCLSDHTAAREFRVRTRDGVERWVLARGKVVERSADGRALRMVGTVMDITRQKRTETDLRLAKDAAEAATEAKGRFLAMMSHEIRTPMNGVIGFAELLAETRLDSEQREFLGLIESSGRTLVAIINDILDFSRIDAGRMELSIEEFSPRDAVFETVELLRPRAVENNVVLGYSIDAAVPGTVFGDPVRFRQILLNLLGNAVKFTKDGRVSVSMNWCEFEDDAHGRLLLAVQDTGVGIPKESLSTIFDPFAQADMSVTRKYGGTGLGLAITGRLVELMNGTIRVESEPDVGSVFTVELAMEAGTSRPADVPGDDAPYAGTRVLLSESNRVTRFSTLRHLHALGCDVDVAETPADLQRLLGEKSFDILFIDPHTAAAVDHFSADGDGPGVRVVGLGSLPPGTLIDGRLEVPFDRDAIRSELEKALGARK